MSPEGDDDKRCWTRRQFLRGTTAAFAALGTAASACHSARCNQPGAEPNHGEGESVDDSSPDSSPADNPTDLDEIRAEFDVDPQLVHMAGMLLATHPRRVREAIETYRRGLDDNPTEYLYQNWARSTAQLDDDGEQRAMAAAARYLETTPSNIALTDSTTEGLATVYHGIDIRPDQEVVTGHWNHWATEGSLRYAAQKTGFEIRRVPMYDELPDVTEDELVDRLVDELSPQTRVVAVTWVHSISGLKLPIGAIGQRIEEINRGRASADRILFCVDGVHGFGVEDAVMADFHCDFFIAGCHKWLFGPRGTGIIAASSDAWPQATPTVPSFSMQTTQGRRFTPGGFKTYEHIWALDEAFEFHLDIGKDRVEQHIHDLAGRLVDELDEMGHVHLRTPRRPSLRSGIVTFRIDGHGPYQIVDHLRAHDIVASVTPEDHPVARLSPGLLNDDTDIEQTLDALTALRT